MRVFLSWSGTLSKAIATALVDWLPYVVPPTKPWMSEHDIQAGSMWEQELSTNLGATDCGVLVLTRDNQGAPWLLFEAGVLNKSTSKQRVIPYRVNLTMSEVAAPLTRFQGVDANMEGTQKLARSLNSALPEPVPADRLSTLFEVFWPRLESALNEALTSTASTTGKRRQPEEYLEEILELLRNQDKTESSEPSPRVSTQPVAEILKAKVTSLAQKILSMEEYERKGGGASTETWWDSYVERHRRVRDLYTEALSLVERANGISLNQ